MSGQELSQHLSSKDGGTSSSEDDDLSHWPGVNRRQTKYLPFLLAGVLLPAAGVVIVLSASRCTADISGSGADLILAETKTRPYEDANELRKLWGPRAERIAPGNLSLPVAGSDWFVSLFGFQETHLLKSGDVSGLDAVQNKFSYDPNFGELRLKGTDKVWQAGQFATPTLEELWEAAQKAIPKLEAQLKSAGRLRKRSSLILSQVVSDVTELITNPDNEGALFQAASQFNCLEFTGPEQLPEQGITCYKDDWTQGPASAISCGPGTVVRNYFALNTSKGSMTPQTKDKQVENLSEVRKVLHNYGLSEKTLNVVGGYTTSTVKDLPKLNDLVVKNKEARELIKRKLKIGLQTNTQVTSSGFGKKPYTGVPFSVNQAYCSALALGSYANPPGDWEPFARVVLEAEYEALLAAAALNALKNWKKKGSTKVFLTKLGGGVFGNHETWIFDAIKNACDKFQDVNLDVILVSFGHRDPKYDQMPMRTRKLMSDMDF